MAWGVEARVPFLDADFLEYAMSMNPTTKMVPKGGMEKDVLRRAFDTPDRPYLPAHVLWRQKEQFSDGVGYGWIDHLKVCLSNMLTFSTSTVSLHRLCELSTLHHLPRH